MQTSKAVRETYGVLQGVFAVLALPMSLLQGIWMGENNTQGHEGFPPGLLKYSLLIGITPLVPIPFLDDYLRRIFRRRMVGSLIRNAGSGSVPAEAVEALIREEGRGCLLGCLSSVFLYPLKKIFRKVFFFLEWKRAVDMTSHSFHFGYLVDFSLRKDLLQNANLEKAAAIRNAINLTCDAATVQPIESAIRTAFKQSRPALTKLRNLFATSGPARKEAEVEKQVEADIQAAQPQLSDVTEKLEEEISKVSPGHFKVMEERFLGELKRIG
jgi:hypothetical protein